MSRRSPKKKDEARSYRKRERRDRVLGRRRLDDARVRLPMLVRLRKLGLSSYDPHVVLDGQLFRARVVRVRWVSYFAAGGGYRVTAYLTPSRMSTLRRVGIILGFSTLAATPAEAWERLAWERLVR